MICWIISLQLHLGITKGQECDVRNVYGLAFSEDLGGKDNALVAKEQLLTLHGKPFESIVWVMP